MDKIAPYWKSLVAFIAPGAVVIGSAVTESSPRGEAITAGEWITAVVAAVVTAAAVYRVPNKDPNATHQAESVQPPEQPILGKASAPGELHFNYGSPAVGILGKASAPEDDDPHRILGKA